MVKTLVAKDSSAFTKHLEVRSTNIKLACSNIIIIAIWGHDRGTRFEQKDSAKR